MKVVASQAQKITSQQAYNNTQRHTTAAIMFTDIVGYTQMMEVDQAMAMRLLEKNRNLQQYCIEQYGGTWIKEMGDGILASFASANDAVECALNIQDACKNISRLELRIGIDLGQVVFTNKDVFGMVVNIASRLQCLAKPGQILVSASVAQNISSSINCIVNSLGSRRLKNVSQTIYVHRIGDLNEASQFSWWSFTSKFPVQKAIAIALLISSFFRF